MMIYMIKWIEAMIEWQFARGLKLGFICGSDTAKTGFNKTDFA